jgi:ApaG protein
VTILGRKWVVREDDGEVTVVEGDGVVGQTPVIDPGGHFSYNSYHVVAHSAEASGAFFGLAAGERIYTRIPAFRLETR